MQWEVQQTQMRDRYQSVKRVCDFAIAALAFVVLSPLIVAIAAAIRLDSPGSALFSQWRVGRGHKLFKMYKFRTMFSGADLHSQYLLDGSEIFIQRENDPRLTRIGCWMRKLSLDELPQLYNILRGEMSFVGPRPLILREHNKLPPIALHRLDLRPGLAGYAQAEGRSSASLPDRCARDLYYVQHSCLWLDVRILIGSIKAVLGRDSAY